MGTAITSSHNPVEPIPSYFGVRCDNNIFLYVILMHTFSVMTLVIPTAYFAALDRGFTVTEAGAQILVNDKIRGEFLHMSRGTAIFLLLMLV